MIDNFQLVLRTFALVAGLALLPALAGAQTSGTMDVSLPSSALTDVVRDGRWLTVAQNQARQQRTDSLWNGILVGAGLGGLIGAAGSLAISDCNECSGFNVPLTFGILGAGVGAGIGAGIDALRYRYPTITSQPHRIRRVRLLPLVAKEVRGMVAAIRF